MVYVKFNDVPDAQSNIIPPGDYPVKISNVEERMTQTNSIMWNLTLEVIEGPYQGRRLYDNLVFSQKALPHVKMACKAVGVDVSREMDLQKEHLLGRTCVVTLEISEWNGKERNQVTFDGYSQYMSGSPNPGRMPSATEIYNDEIPF